MKAHLPVRFWIESGMAAASGILLLVTIVSRTWVEAVFRVDPDRGSGSLEWLIVAAALAITVTSATLAGREWSRRHAATV